MRLKLPHRLGPMNDPETITSDVAVVGAGLAGLVAARLLLSENGVRPIVLEARGARWRAIAQ
jgi:flavin-dependent dehydrogenase